MISSSSSQSPRVKTWITLEINIISICREMLPNFAQARFSSFFPPIYSVFILFCVAAPVFFFSAFRVAVVARVNYSRSSDTKVVVSIPGSCACHVSVLERKTELQPALVSLDWLYWSRQNCSSERRKMILSAILDMFYHYFCSFSFTSDSLFTSLWISCSSQACPGRRSGSGSCEKQGLWCLHLYPAGRARSCCMCYSICRCTYIDKGQYLDQNANESILLLFINLFFWLSWCLHSFNSSYLLTNFHQFSTLINWLL